MGREFRSRKPEKRVWDVPSCLVTLYAHRELTCDKGGRLPKKSRGETNIFPFIVQFVLKKCKGPLFRKTRGEKDN